MDCNCALCVGVLPPPKAPLLPVTPESTPISVTEGGRLGWKLRPGAVPSGTREWKHGSYDVYSLEDFVPKLRRAIAAAVEVDLLVAVFTVNRTAKRFRNAAAKQYNSANHGFAGAAKEKKQALYKLKDRGMVEAFRRGLIHAVGTHGPLTYYEGSGYRFHSLLRPLAGSDLPQLSDETVVVEAKPKGARECRLLDAEFTLSKLPDSIEGFFRFSFPPRRRQRDDWEDWED